MANRGKHSKGKHSVPRRRSARGGAGSAPASHEHARTSGAHYRKGAHSRRPKRRRARRALVLAAAVAVALVLGMAARATVLAPSPAQEGQTATGTQQMEEGEVTPAEEYASVVALVNQADRTVVPMSKLVSKTLDDKVAKRTKKVLGGKDAAEKLLEEAARRLEAVTPQLDQQSRAQARKATALADAISAREDMLRYGKVVLDAGVGAYELTDDVVGTWQHFIDGVGDLRDASKQVAGGTTKEVQRARKLDKRALGHFEDAAELIETIAKAAPGVDLTAERNYARLQQEAAQEAVATDEALLQEDEKAAKKHNAAYAKKSAAASKAAKKLPATTDDLVKSVYYSLGADGVTVQDAQNKYDAAAKRASKADKKLVAED